jgi:hypothetical protein
MIRNRIFWFIIFYILGTALLLSCVHARDVGQWQDNDTTRWFQSLKMPDSPDVSCCGEADAYHADAYEVTKDGEYVAIITDTRDDKPLHRVHIDVGTKIIVPKYKIKWDQGNPTGHGIIFLNSSQHVYCYLPPGGV